MAPSGILRLTSPGSPASHVPVNLHAHSPRRLTHFPPKIARRCGLAPWQEVCHFHPHSRPRGPTALAEVESSPRVFQDMVLTSLLVVWWGQGGRSSSSFRPCVLHVSSSPR